MIRIHKPVGRAWAGTNLGGMGASYPHPRHFAVKQGEMVVNCISAVQSTGQRTIEELLLLKNRSKQNNLARQSLKVASLGVGH